jgi:signal transduction histidine kinase
VEVSVASDLPPLVGVRDQLVQVFLNLILNAIDATGKNGRIHVTGRYASPNLEIVVRDNGTGISTEQAARIFEPYFTTKKHGTGLGLFVTRKLVAAHGGTIEFESTPGQGTEFRVCLPASTERIVTEQIAAEIHS